MEVLTAYVREKACWRTSEAPEEQEPEEEVVNGNPWWQEDGLLQEQEALGEDPCEEDSAEPAPLPQIPLDIQAVLTVLKRRKIPAEPSCNTLDLRGINAPGVDLRDGDLRWADLRGSRLEGGDFTYANLGNARLQGSSLDRAVLWGANLEEANLTEATLEAANLGAANLKKAKLPWAYLRAAEFEAAWLQEADLRQACLHCAHLGANLTGADPTGAHLEAADLTRAEGLTQLQVDSTVKDVLTRLPGHLRAEGGRQEPRRK